MKIVRNTPEQLILRSRPWLLAVLFGGFILISIGFGLNAVFAGNWERAIIQSSNSGDGGPTHRIALVLSSGMDAGTHPVTPDYVSGRGAERGVEAINAWLSGNVDSDAAKA